MAVFWACWAVGSGRDAKAYPVDSTENKLIKKDRSRSGTHSGLPVAADRGCSVESDGFGNQLRVLFRIEFSSNLKLKSPFETSCLDWHEVFPVSFIVEHPEDLPLEMRRDSG